MTTTSNVGADASREWQPIETAPKDSSYIIAARFGGNSGGNDLRWVTDARWITAGEIADIECGDPDDFEACWVRAEDESDEIYPTHWMPLPTPPAGETK